MHWFKFSLAFCLFQNDFMKLINLNPLASRYVLIVISDELSKTYGTQEEQVQELKPVLAAGYALVH